MTHRTMALLETEYSDSLIDFVSLIPDDIKIFAPTIYAKLNILNYCQYLRDFLNHKEITCSCEHQLIISTKLKIIQQIITKIVDADTVFESIKVKSDP